MMLGFVGGGVDFSAPWYFLVLGEMSIYNWI